MAGRTLNAFDLVRLHLYGAADDKASPDTTVSKLPSYKKMIQLVMADERSAQELTRTKLAEAQADFEGLAEEPAPEEEEEGKKEDKRTATTFRYTETGQIKRDPFNLEIILRETKPFKGRLGYNEFNGEFEKLAKMPWDDKLVSRHWSDEDTALLKSFVNEKYELLFGDDRIIDCLIVVSKDRPFNPVKDYITQAEWDGQKRLETLFIDYLGAEDSSYVREVTELWFAAAVARIFKPGIKFDQVPVLEGAQGIGKSTLIHKLAGEWFTDGLQKLDSNKDDLLLLGRAWIVELSELASMGRTHIDQAKGFISRTEDSYRPPFGRLTVTQPRHVVFVGTTNNAEFLKDATGNRRWYPIPCSKGTRTKSVFDGSVEKNLGQFWAEAHHLYLTKYKEGEALVLSMANERLANEARQAAEAPDVTKDLVLEYLEVPKPPEWETLSMKDKVQFMADYEAEFVMSEWGDKQDTFELQTFVTSREIYESMIGRYLGKAARTAQANGEIRKIGMTLSGLECWNSKVKKVQGKSTRGFERDELAKEDALDILG